jgi:hypothetical protein
VILGVLGGSPVLALLCELIDLRRQCEVRLGEPDVDPCRGPSVGQKRGSFTRILSNVVGILMLCIPTANHPIDGAGHSEPFTLRKIRQHNAEREALL